MIVPTAYTASGGAVGSAAWRYRGRLDISPAGLGTPLYAMGARLYSPGVGAFTSLDTVAGSAQSPLSMNRFLYAQADPATLVDPTGHSVIDENDNGTTLVHDRRYVNKVFTRSAWTRSQRASLRAAEARRLAARQAALRVRARTGYLSDQLQDAQTAQAKAAARVAARTGHGVADGDWDPMADAEAAYVPEADMGKAHIGDWRAYLAQYGPVALHILLTDPGYAVDHPDVWNTAAQYMVVDAAGRGHNLIPAPGVFIPLDVAAARADSPDLAVRAMADAPFLVGSALSGVAGVAGVRGEGGGGGGGGGGWGSMPEPGEGGGVPGIYLAGEAPRTVTPGTRSLSGVHVNDQGRDEPWVAYYDEYGRLIGRTDYNAGNKAQGIPSVHYATYDWNAPYGKDGRMTANHLPGEFPGE